MATTRLTSLWPPARGRLAHRPRCRCSWAKGDGTFQTAVSYAPLPNGVGYYGLVAADLNGDNQPDLAAASYNFGTGDVLGCIQPGRRHLRQSGELHTGRQGRRPASSMATSTANSKDDLADANGNEFLSKGTVTPPAEPGRWGCSPGRRDYFVGEFPNRRGSSPTSIRTVSPTSPPPIPIRTRSVSPWARGNGTFRASRLNHGDWRQARQRP